jgi:hypothetical protein
MTYTHYSQLYDGWKRVMLGESSTNIGQYGCLLCALASGLTDVGARIDGLPPDPSRLNRWLTRNGGFAAPEDAPGERNLVVFSALTPLGVRLVDYVDCRKMAAPIGRIREALLEESQFAIIEVDFKPGDEHNQHWVRAVEWFESDIKIMDPWMIDVDHEAYLMTRYAAPAWDNPARAVFRIAVYRYDPGAVPFGIPGVEEISVVQEYLCPYQP